MALEKRCELGKKKTLSKRRQYDEKDMQQCILSVKSGKQSIYGASNSFGIPESTVRFRLSDKWSKKTRKGPQTVMTEEEENKLVGWIKDMQRKGFPVVKDTLSSKIKSFFNSNSRQNPFRNGTPGRKWFKSFLQRHKTISLRRPEAVSAASAKVSESDIRGWFSQVTSYLEEQGLLEALQDATRVYNGDETSFFLHPKTKAVLAARGSRNVYEVEHANSHMNITVMFSFAADGSIVPPNIILPMQRIRADLLRTFPADWGIGKSEKGWMDASNFELYVRKVFYPFILKKGVTFPVIYFVDGHSSHMAANVVDLCVDLGIILIVLYPNTTRITQPADVAIFKPLKNAWKAAVSEWHDKNNGEILTLKHFGMVLQEAMNHGIVANNIRNGFRACGLHPFNADSIDYSKCIAKPAADTKILEVPLGHNEEIQICKTDSTSSPYNIDSVVIPCKTIELAFKEIGETRLKKITSAGELSDDAVVIRNIYEKLIKPFRFSRLPNNSIDLEATSSNQNYEPVETFKSTHMDAQMQELIVDFQTSNEGLSKVKQKDSFEVRSQSFSNSKQISTLELTSDSSDSDDMIGHSSIFVNNTENSSGFTGDKLVADESTFEQQRTTSIQIAEDYTLSGTSEELSNTASENITDQEEHVLMSSISERVSSPQRKISISGFLQCPATPKRSRNHRNYTQKFYPVLTAGERLEEIRRIEEKKKNILQQKKEKAERRAEKKIANERQRAEKRELIKKRTEIRIQKKIEAENLKAVVRERKRQEMAIRNEKRDNLRKEKEKRTAGMRRGKKDRVELFEYLKLARL